MVTNSTREPNPRRFLIDFSPFYAVLPFIEVARQIAACDKYGEIIRLHVRQPLWGGDYRLELFCGHHDETPITHDQIEQLPQQFAGDDLAIEGWWEVLDRYFSYSPDDPTPVQTTYRAIFMVKGEEFGRDSSPREYDMRYEPGREYLFTPSAEEKTARLNLQALLGEMPFLTGLGSETIRGLDGDESENPLHTYLCYHRDPNYCRHDLVKIGDDATSIPDVTGEDIMFAVQRCGNADYVEASGQPVVYAKGFAGSRLRKFYNVLFDCVKERS